MLFFHGKGINEEQKMLSKHNSYRCVGRAYTQYILSFQCHDTYICIHMYRYTRSLEPYLNIY